ncbi:hypothetical protein K1719_009517 [Acacia pycnantha]|nr:hypothetical protein K1719_009517 [Acacia pycnantha]
MEEKLPSCGIKACPHITSRLKTLKCLWQAAYDMVYGTNTSGFGWDPDTKFVTADNKVCNDYLKQLRRHHTIQIVPVSVIRSLFSFPCSFMPSFVCDPNSTTPPPLRSFCSAFCVSEDGDYSHGMKKKYDSSAVTMEFGARVRCFHNFLLLLLLKNLNGKQNKKEEKDTIPNDKIVVTTPLTKLLPNPSSEARRDRKRDQKKPMIQKPKATSRC